MASAQAQNQPTILLDGVQIQLEGDIQTINDRVYVPVRMLSDALGAIVKWSPLNQEIEIFSEHGDRLQFNIHRYQMIWNEEVYLTDTLPFILNDKTYLPLRHVAEFLHSVVSWDPDQNVIFLNRMNVYKVQERLSVKTLSVVLDISEELLRERNGIEEDYVLVGTEIKTVIPTLMRSVLTPPEQYLLAQIVYREAGYEILDGQIAVANVVINRVNSSRFPNTIREVIYQQGQFTPAMNGTLESAVPNDASIHAARQALLGVNKAGNALYFYNPRVSKSSFFNRLQSVIEIGNHLFKR